MLQIASAKFFKSPRYIRNPGRAVLYTNYHLFSPIRTKGGTIVPVTGLSRSITTCLYSYLNRMEEQAPRPGVITRAGDSELVEQFRLLSIFALRAYVATHVWQVEHLTRTRPRSSDDYLLPSTLVPEFFATSIEMDAARDARLSVVVEQALALPRTRWTAVLSYLSGFVGALEALDQSIDLGYSMFVYCLESLAQFEDISNQATWSDYPEEARARLDAELAGIDQGAAERIRVALLDGTHLRLQQKYLTFVLKHIRQSFFVQDSSDGRKPGRISAFRPSNVSEALINAYDLRSGYVHRLQPIKQHLRMPNVAIGDTFEFDRRIYPTLRGLVRLCIEVLEDYLEWSPKVVKEEFDWRSELPGVVTMQMAPQYWIGKVSPSDDMTSAAWFSGVMSNILNVIGGREKDGLTDLRMPLSALSDQNQPKATIARRLLVAGMIWNDLIEPSASIPGWQKVEKRYSSSLSGCTIESMVLWVFLPERFEWSFDVALGVLDRYLRSRTKPAALSLPLRLEVALVIMVALQAEREHRGGEATQLLQAAILECGSEPVLQMYLMNVLSGGEPFDFDRIFSDVPRRCPDDGRNRERAYFRWLARGSPPGDDLADWFDAEGELSREDS